MTRRDGLFLLIAGFLTATVAPLLSAVRLFGEEQYTQGIWMGWGAALLIMIPSWFLLSRALVQTRPNAFLAGFLGGALGRLALTVCAVFAVWAFFPSPPLKAFVLAYFLGYFILTAVELCLTTTKRFQPAEPKGSL